MFLRRLSVVFGSDDLDADTNKVGWGRSKTIFELTFGLIEAGVILGALGAAWDL